MKVVAPTKKPIQLKPVRPNAGLTAAYRKNVDGELAKMQADVLRTLSLIYEDDPPELAADESPAAALRQAIEMLKRRWRDRFDDLAQTWSRKFTADATIHADRSLSRALREAGFTVKFRMTAAAQDVFTATVAEQVNLIRSIPEQCLTQVQSLVTESVQTGRDIGFLAKAVQEQFGVSKRRAATIARDQNAKATATIARVRQQELGVTTARWLHSAGGHHPRPEHVAFSKGTHHGANHGPFYEVAKGAYLEGKWVWPGSEINCRCVAVSVIPGLD